MNSNEIGALLTMFVLLFIGPFISIWSINTIFGLGISYSIETWLGMVWLHLLFSTRSKGE